MPERRTSILSVRGLRRTFGELAAVDGLDLDLPPGECVALIGHNGSGKTTALRVMGGRLEPTAGTVTVNGADVHDRRRGQKASRASPVRTTKRNHHASVIEPLEAREGTASIAPRPTSTAEPIPNFRQGVRGMHEGALMYLEALKAR
jgi:ABC-type branched-subunit amino acid transport system ATPase component